MLFVVLLGLAVCCVIVSETDFQLVKDKHPAAAFVLQNHLPDSVKLAVKDFNADLKRATGAELPAEAAPSEGLGRRIIFDIKPAELMNDDKFEITFPDTKTMQINASPRSVKWALNHILEEFVGVRWLFPGKHGTHWPSKSDIAIPRRTIGKQASFSLERYLSYPIEPWQVKLNAKDVLKFNHELTVYAFPVEKYLANQSWPVEIMPVIRGKKLVAVTNPRSGWQPCYSNQKTVEAAVENICEYLKNNPSAKCVSIGVNDSMGFCECDICLKGVAGKRNSINMPNYSDGYYNWANQVAAAVSARYPDVYFGCLAYCRVMDPPSFNLHPKIIPFICFDAYACLDPEIQAKRFKMMEDWSKKVSCIGRWDYSYSIPRYHLPRIYFNLQKDILKRTYQLGGRAMFVEAYPNASDGPSKYLLMKLLWDVNADINTLLDDWYLTCVGGKSAPFLKQYFQFWEEYWRGDDIKRTSWFVEGKNGVYLNIDGPDDYFLALKPGDLARCRKLMEQVQANASTPEQQARAKIFMFDFEFYELSAKAYNAEKISAHGSLDSEAQAIDLIRNIPNALDSANKRKDLIEKNTASFPDRKYYADCLAEDFVDFIDEKLNLVALFVDSPNVQAAIAGLIDNEEIPDKIKTHAEMMLALASDKPVKNILPGRETSIPFGGNPSQKFKFRDNYSAGHYVKGNRFVLSCNQAVLPENTSYMLSARVFLENSDNGIVEVWMTAHNSKTGRDMKYKDAPPPSFKLIPGKWNMVCSTLAAPKQADTIIIYLVCRNLDGKAIYVADAKLSVIESPNSIKGDLQ